MKSERKKCSVYKVNFAERPVKITQGHPPFIRYNRFNINDLLNYSKTGPAFALNVLSCRACIEEFRL
ncbi:MAG: hypothetical protein CBB68_09530 [Rhodospirillaceae bacterium TMED8]|nr:hypothetical protein [Magnetovibrio sp.]OUT50101.1 MAG: hypothetical protein CBB68_09530 [Rhodospirillaceae bacterium TMED8]